MSHWMDDFLRRSLEGVPEGAYRARAEAELRDHLLALCRDLEGAGHTPEEARTAALAQMGDPEKLKEEYLAAWKRSCPGRLKALGLCLRAWAGGIAVMAGTHLLISYILSMICSMALSLPGDSQDPWVRLIRGTVGDLHNSLFWRHLFPFALALTAGAYYLSRKLPASRRPAALISEGLCVHWAYITAINAWWSAIDNHHRPFWEAVGRYFYFNARYHAFTLLLCILLGVVFGQTRERRHKLA